MDAALSAHLVPALRAAHGGDLAATLDDMVAKKSIKHGATPDGSL